MASGPVKERRSIKPLLIATASKNKPEGVNEIQFGRREGDKGLLMESLFGINRTLGELTVKVSSVETVQENIMACVQEISTELSISQRTDEQHAGEIAISGNKINKLTDHYTQSKILILLLAIGVFLIGLDTIKIYFPTFVPAILNLFSL